MPMCYSSSSKPNGFSINDIIKNDHVFTTSIPSPSLPLPWLSSSMTIYQMQRETMLHYLRQAHPFSSLGVSSALFLSSFRKPKRNRTAFTPSQLLKLENAFEKNHYIVGQERKELAKHLNLPETKVKVWYQNRRTKHKRSRNEDGSSSMNEIDHRTDLELSDVGVKNDPDDFSDDEEND